MSLTVRISRVQDEAESIRSFELVSTTGAPLPAFSAGSHVDVHVPGGLVRQYSLCNDPGETHRYLIAILRDKNSRGGSSGMHEGVHEGSVLEISGPKNHFPLVHDARKSLLIAGGIGITPILCMAERLSNAGADFEMHYATRSPSRTAFHDRIVNSPFASRVRFYFGDGSSGTRLDVTGLLGEPKQGQHLYVCGPQGLIDAVLSAAKGNGWPEPHIHYEFFAGSKQDSGDEGAEFDVRLASSGRLITVPAGTTVVQALARHGVIVPTSCEQGVCGTCLTRVLDGEPDHKDLYLTPQEHRENSQFLPCCSRSKSKVLVLDL